MNKNNKEIHRKETNETEYHPDNQLNNMKFDMQCMQKANLLFNQMHSPHNCIVKCWTLYDRRILHFHYFVVGRLVVVVVVVVSFYVFFYYMVICC